MNALHAMAISARGPASRRGKAYGRYAGCRRAAGPGSNHDIASNREAAGQLPARGQPRVTLQLSRLFSVAGSMPAVRL